MTDHYNTLGIPRNASPEDIKRAYRKLAAEHHPDRGGNTAKFQEIQSAYSILSDPGKRSEYDSPQPQMNGFHFQAGGMPPGFEDLFRQFGDPFGNMFRQQSQRNRTLNIQTSISLEEAFQGKDLMATLKLPSGREQMIELKIPPGIQDGTTLRVNGLGDDSVPNIPRGDLHLTVHVHPHHIFLRQGDDLIRNFEINCIDAMLGKSMTINSIDGTVLDLKIPPGCQPGHVMAIAGHGMPNINNIQHRGRLLVNIGITVPTGLNNQQIQLLKQVLNQ